MPHPRTILYLALTAAILVFAIVQDRTTAAGAREYVTSFREAAAGRRAPVTIDAVMKPAIRRSVRLGLLWGGAVLACGMVLAAAAHRSARRPRSTQT